MNQQIKTWLGTAVLIIIAITVGTFVWIFEKDKSIETDVQTIKVIPAKKEEVPKVFNKIELESAVILAVDVATKNIWDKKIEVSAVDPSQKAAKGFWWAQDKWGWIAWQKEDGSWNVEVDRDGFDCNGLKNIPAESEQFFYDAIRFNGKINCYDWKDKVSEWKTYQNEKYGFEFQYPAIFSSSYNNLDDNGKVYAHFDFKDNSKYGGQFRVYGLNEKFDINNVIDGDNKINKDKISIKYYNGIKGYLYTVGGEGGTAKIVLFPHDMEIVKFEFGDPVEAEYKVQQFLDQILSTFKFTK